LPLENLKKKKKANTESKTAKKRNQRQFLDKWASVSVVVVVVVASKQHYEGI
jgi:hypothetical protein